MVKDRLGELRARAGPPREDSDDDDRPGNGGGGANADPEALEMDPLRSKEPNVADAAKGAKRKKKRKPVRGMGEVAGQSEEFSAFLARMAAVVSDTAELDRNAAEVRSLHRLLLTATRRDEAKEARVDDLMAQNKRLAKSIRDTLKAERDWLDANRENVTTTVALREYQMRRTQVDANLGTFYDLWRDYNNEQVEYQDKVKKLYVKRLQIVGVELTEDEIEEKLKERDTAVFARGILDQERVARQKLSEVESRHNEFMKLEDSVREVRDMFLEVNQLVQEQGEQLDRIDIAVISAQADVEKGKGELQSAEQHMRSARKKKIICGILLAVVLLIVVLVVLSEFGAFGGGGGSTETKIVYVEVTPSTTSSTTTTTSAAVAP